MTIFDTLRYPISDMPTPTQLAALPPSLMIDWKEKFSYVHDATPGSIVGWMMGEYDYDPPRIHNEVDTLRQMIKDYDNI